MGRHKRNPGAGERESSSVRTLFGAYLVPEPRVQEVQDRVLLASNVQVDRHPVLVRLLAPSGLGVPW